MAIDATAREPARAERLAAQFGFALERREGVKSGVTILLGRDAARNDALRTRAGATETYSAALCRNAGSAVIPDLWIWTVRDWVTFPWERVAPAPATTPLPFPRSARWHA